MRTFARLNGFAVLVLVETSGKSLVRYCGFSGKQRFGKGQFTVNTCDLGEF